MEIKNQVDKRGGYYGAAMAVSCFWQIWMSECNDIANATIGPMEPNGKDRVGLPPDDISVLDHVREKYRPRGGLRAAPNDSQPHQLNIGIGRATPTLTMDGIIADDRAAARVQDDRWIRAYI